jgi:hypothetical protein
MTKFLAFGLLFLLSFNTYAQKCASNIEELKVLIGDSSLPLAWIENGRNPLELTVSDGESFLSLKLTLDGEPWADVKGEVCQKGRNFVAVVSELTWGSAAPRMVKGVNIKELTLKFPYQSVLKVKVSLMSFEFLPL